jgi:acyl carrier protein
MEYRKTEKITQGIKEIFLDIFPELKGKKFSLDKKLLDLRDWDSFNYMQLISRIEEAFMIELDMGEMLEAEDVKNIIGIVERKQKNEESKKIAKY